MYINGRVKILPLNCRNRGLSRRTRIVGLEIQGCMRPISIFNVTVEASGTRLGQANSQVWLRTERWVADVSG